MTAPHLHETAELIRRRLRYGGSGHPFYAAVAEFLDSVASDPCAYCNAGHLADTIAAAFRGDDARHDRPLPPESPEVASE